LVGKSPRAAAAILGLALVAGVLILTQGLVHYPPAGMTCPNDNIVWMNNKSHTYQRAAHHFGSTKGGKFMCEHDAGRQGNRLAAGESGE
jgi:hypothetical protein